VSQFEFPPRREPLIEQALKAVIATARFNGIFDPQPTYKPALTILTELGGFATLPPSIILLTRVARLAYPLAFEERKKWVDSGIF
jgi:hypothetical protein